MDNYDFADSWEEAMAGRNFILSASVMNAIEKRLRDYLNSRLSSHESMKTPESINSNKYYSSISD